MSDKASPGEQVRRRSLLPGWIKFFTWVFLIFGVMSGVVLILGLFGIELDLSLYGLETTQVYSLTGLILVALFSLKGITAYGLWWEQDWAVTVALGDALIGIAICIFMMLTNPLVEVEDGFFNFIGLRLELIFLIPYLIKMLRIRKAWK